MNPELRTPQDASPSRGTSTARSRFLALIVSLAVLAVASIGFASTASAKPRPPINPDAAAVTGTVDGTAVTGTFDVTRFAVQDGTLQAVGTLGDLKDATGTTLLAAQQITLPVVLPDSSSCQILHLELGPLDLNLLGLQVHLDKVVLDITAVPGPNNLLGNLLCAIAGLLNGPTGLNAILTQIAALLNQLLGVLG
jgi:hypothetical protein